MAAIAAATTAKSGGTKEAKMSKMKRFWMILPALGAAAVAAGLWAAATALRFW